MERVAQQGLSELPLELIQNDFESDVCAFCPAVADALECAREFFPDTTSVTGSGAAMFSLVSADYESRIAAYLTQAQKRNITVHRTRLIR
jgi:4-diphosphocytidyl-2C-methyl-D-erythritol kinase